jgi:hypothetical protein
MSDQNIFEEALIFLKITGPYENVSSERAIIVERFF